MSDIEQYKDNSRVSPASGMALYRARNEVVRHDIATSKEEAKTFRKIRSVVEVTQEAIYSTDYLADLAVASANGNAAKRRKNAEYFDQANLDIHQLVHDHSRRIR